MSNDYSFKDKLQDAVKGYDGFEQKKKVFEALAKSSTQYFAQTGRNVGRMHQMLMYYEELKQTLRYVIRNDAERVIEIVEQNTTVPMRAVTALNFIVDGVLAGADISKCKTLEEINKECYRSFVMR